MSEEKTIYAKLEEELLNLALTEKQKNKLLKKLQLLRENKLNIMLVGATGCGKSSTINALFNCAELQVEDAQDGATDACGRTTAEGEGAVVCEEDVVAKANSAEKLFVEVAKVGSKSDPETKDIEKYTIGNLTLWDTPGLGDGTEIDEHHKAVIRDLLNEADENGNKLIDIVLVILDGSTRDLGTSYKILNEVIIPEFGKKRKRILVALNQADIAMKTGRHWDYEKNEPDEVLVKFLEEKLVSIKERIYKDSGLEVEPIYYCAGYVEPEGSTVYPYNLTKLLYYILQAVPTKKRLSIMEGMNKEKKNYKHNDDDYSKKVQDSFLDTIFDAIDEGAALGKELLGLPGAVIGGVVGGIVGAVVRVLGNIFA
ncbi:MAG: GTPase family protein [Phascolarctobacterium sp.]